MADYLRQELRDFAQRLTVSDFRPLSAGLGWSVKKVAVVPDQKIAMSDINNAALSLGTLATSRKDDPQGSKSQGGAAQFPVAPPLTKEESSAPRGRERGVPSRSTPHRFFLRVLRQMSAVLMDLFFIIASVALTSALLAVHSDPGEFGMSTWFIWLTERMIPLFSLAEWGVVSGLIFLIYSIFFRILVGATLGETVAGIKGPDAIRRKNKRLRNKFI